MSIPFLKDNYSLSTFLWSWKKLQFFFKIFLSYINWQFYQFFHILYYLTSKHKTRNCLAGKLKRPYWKVSANNMDKFGMNAMYAPSYPIEAMTH